MAGSFTIFCVKCERRVSATRWGGKLRATSRCVECGTSYSTVAGPVAEKIARATRAEAKMSRDSYAVKTRSHADGPLCLCGKRYLDHIHGSLKCSRFGLRSNQVFRERGVEA